MAEYQYRGRRASGELVSGELEALSADNVADQLLNRGVTPVEISEKQVAPGINLQFDIFKPRVKLEDLIMFSRQMFSLNRAGVPINQAMKSLADSSTNERMSDALGDVGGALNAGMPLSSAMTKHREIFDSMYVNMVRVGENSGQLEAVFKQLASYLELEKETRRRLKAAVRYPSFVLVAIVIAIVVMNLFVIPVFAELFSKFGSELPLPTRILIASSSFFVNYWPFLLLFVAVLGFAWRHFISTVKGRLWWDRKKLKLPIIGSILERAMLARFSRGFALMLASGVPLTQALDMSARAVGNASLALKIDDMRAGIERGDNLQRTAARSGMFTPLVLQMIQVGEETGRVDELLSEVAQFYEDEVDYDLKNLSSAIEPILIVAIAGLVMLLALGIFLPMWDMYGAMSR